MKARTVATFVRSSLCALAAFAGLVLLLPRPAEAATCTWNGSGAGAGDIFDVSTNWGGTLPGVSNSDTALFNGANSPYGGGALSLYYSNGSMAGSAGNAGIIVNLTASQTATVTLDTSTAASLRIAGISVAAGAGAFTLGNSANATAFSVTLGGAAGTQTFTNNSSSPFTVNSNVAFGTGGGGAHVLALAGSGNFVFNNSITNSSGSWAVSQNGTGIVTLAKSNSYTGATTLASGTLQLANSAALAGSALTINSGATLQLRADADAVFAPASANTGGLGTVAYNFNVGSLSGSASGNTLTLANWGQFGPPSTTDTFNLTGANGYTLQLGSGASGNGPLLFYNNTTLNSNSPGITMSIPGGLSVNYPAAYSLGFGGAGNFMVGSISQSGANTLTPTFSGSGTVTLTGNNSYTGATTVTSGRLAFTGSITATATIAVGNTNGIQAAMYQSMRE